MTQPSDVVKSFSAVGALVVRSMLPSFWNDGSSSQAATRHAVSAESVMKARSAFMVSVPRS